MTRKGLFTLVTFAVLLCVVAAPAAARKVTGEGHATYAQTGSEEYALPDGRSTQRAKLSGFVMATDPNNPLHNNHQTCTGTTIVAADGTATVGNGYCDAVDADGDVWWLWWTADWSNATGTWGFLGGTGKFAGVEGGGTTTVTTQWPDGSLTINWKGTWEMK